MAFENEVTYLRAFALEKLGRKGEAIMTYRSIRPGPNSYYGSLATERITLLGGKAAGRRLQHRQASIKLARNYPLKFRYDLIRHSKARGIDPRFVLAIMKQESSFRPRAKSPAAARGLLQLTYDTALKYNKQAGYGRISATDLYRPNVNIAIGIAYIAELRKQFGGLYEAVAASYNGGEDNSARWLNRSNPKSAAVFASEVGFSETKRYVFKVMNNYRVYQSLYTKNLTRR